MSEWSAVNIIDSEDVIALEDRWGVLDEILPLLAHVKGVKPQGFSADNMLMLKPSRQTGSSTESICINSMGCRVCWRSSRTRWDTATTCS